MNAMEIDTGLTAEEYLSNPYDVTLLDYSYVCGQGDPNYVNNVMQYVPNKDNGGVYIYRCKDDNVTLTKVEVTTSLEAAYAKNTH